MWYHCVDLEINWVLNKVINIIIILIICVNFDCLFIRSLAMSDESKSSITGTSTIIRSGSSTATTTGGNGSVLSSSPIRTDTLSLTQSAHSIRVYLGNSNACETCVLSLKCFGKLNIALAESVCYALAAMNLGNKFNQHRSVSCGACEVIVQILEFIQVSGVSLDSNETFQNVIKESCRCIHILASNNEKALSCFEQTNICFVLTSLIQSCFEVEIGSKLICYIWYAIEPLLSSDILRSSLVDMKLCSFLSMSMKLHGGSESVAVWVASCALKVAEDKKIAHLLGNVMQCNVHCTVLNCI